VSFLTELSESKISTQFVLNILRQHEIELDRLIAELEPLVKKVDELTNKMQQFFRGVS
jgi:hypothetical protein